MGSNTTERIQKLFSVAGMGPKYAEMKKEYVQLEKTFSKITQRLQKEDEDAVWAFVCTAEAMNWRMLELICEQYEIAP